MGDGPEREREVFHPWCGKQMGVWMMLVIYRFVSPGLLDFMILRVSDSVFNTP